MKKQGKPTFYREVVHSQYGIVCNHGHFIPGVWVTRTDKQTKRARHDTLSCKHIIIKISTWGVPKQTKRRFCKKCLDYAIKHPPRHKKEMEVVTEIEA